MTAPLSPAPALTAEEAAPDPSLAEQAEIDRFGMFAAEIAAERRCPRCRMDYPDHMPGEDECRPCTRPHADAAEEPEEVTVEKLRTTIAVLRGELATSIRASGAWLAKLRAVEALADAMDRLADEFAAEGNELDGQGWRDSARTNWDAAEDQRTTARRIRAALDAGPTPAPVAHNHTRFRNDAGPWSPCPVSCPAAGLLR